MKNYCEVINTEENGQINLVNYFLCTECSFSDIFIQSLIYISKLRLTYWCTVYSLCFIHIHDLRLFILLVLVELHDNHCLNFLFILCCIILSLSVYRNTLCIFAVFGCIHRLILYLYFLWKCFHRSHLSNEFAFF